VKAGTLGAQVGKQKIVVATGETAVFAAGVVHNWWNARRRFFAATQFQRLIGSQPSGGVCCSRRQPEGQAIDLLPGSRFVAAS